MRLIYGPSDKDKEEAQNGDYEANDWPSKISAGPMSVILRSIKEEQGSFFFWGLVSPPSKTYFCISLPVTSALIANPRVTGPQHRAPSEAEIPRVLTQ